MKYSMLFVVLGWRFLRREAMMKKTKDLEEMKFSMMLDSSPSLTIAKSKEPLSINVAIELPVKEPCLHLSLGLLLPPIPSFRGNLQSKDILLMKLVCKHILQAK